MYHIGIISEVDAPSRIGGSWRHLLQVFGLLRPKDASEMGLKLAASEREWNDQERREGAHAAEEQGMHSRQLQGW